VGGGGGGGGGEGLVQFDRSWGLSNLSTVSIS
jgi:hypothetical protein